MKLKPGKKFRLEQNSNTRPQQYQAVFYQLRPLTAYIGSCAPSNNHYIYKHDLHVVYTYIREHSHVHRITPYLSSIRKLSPSDSFGNHLQVRVFVNVTWTKNNVIRKAIIMETGLVKNRLATNNNNNNNIYYLYCAFSMTSFKHRAQNTKKQEDLLDLITALLKFNCLFSTTVGTQCTFQSSH